MENGQIQHRLHRAIASGREKEFLCRWFFPGKNGLFRNLLLLLFISGICNETIAQRTYSKAVGLLSENDSYMLQGKDGYYTNGLVLSYQWMPGDISSSVVHSLSVGQLMYNAKNGSYKEKEEIDRPVTAYLFATYSQTRETASRGIFRWGVSAGSIGPTALGRQAQEGLHHLLGMYRPQEWQYQLKESVGINANAIWSPSWVEIPSFALRPVIGGEAGFFFTNARLGMLMQWGRFGNGTANLFWNGVGRTAYINQKNLSFYFYPEIIAQAYNATVQGGLFLSDKGPVTGRLNPFVYRQRLGCLYSFNNLLFQLGITYENRESMTQLKTQWYGSLGLGWRW